MGMNKWLEHHIPPSKDEKAIRKLENARKESERKRKEYEEQFKVFDSRPHDKVKVCGEWFEYNRKLWWYLVVITENKVITFEKDIVRFVKVDNKVYLVTESEALLAKDVFTKKIIYFCKNKDDLESYSYNYNYKNVIDMCKKFGWYNGKYVE